MFNSYEGLTLGNLFDTQLKRFPNDVVQIFEDGKRQTYNQLNDRANRLANGLLGLGIKKGDFVALYAMNCLEYMEFHLATTRVGIVAVMVNCFMPKERIAYILEMSESKAVIFEDQYQEIVKYCRDRNFILKHCIMINRGKGEPEERTIDYDQLIEASSNRKPDIWVKLTDANTLLFTTGTTGEPKGVLKSQAGDLWAALVNNFFAYYPTASRLSIPPYSRLRHIIVPPMFHIAPRAYHLYCFMFPRSMVIMRGFDPEKFLWVIHREQVNCAWIQPAMLFRIKELSTEVLSRYDRKSVVSLMCGGSATKAEEMDAMVDLFPNATVSSNYASTETGTISFVTREEVKKTSNQNIGMPVLGADVKILDEEENELSHGEIGHIWATCPGLPINCEYYKDPARTKKHFKDGWVTVGDLGYKDEQGYIYYCGRGDEIIRSGGEKISPYAVQSALIEMEGIQAAEVIGVPDEKWGEAVKAVVIRKKGSTVSKDEIIQFCKKRLAKYELPKTVEFVEAFPIGTTGKVSRKDLKEKYGR